MARRAPGRFEALVLDSAAATVCRPERERQRACFWEGTEAGFARRAERVQALAAVGIVSHDEVALVAPLVHELAGPEALDGMLTRAEGGHVRTLKRLHRLAALEVEGGRKPLVFDGDLTLPIWLGGEELGGPRDRDRSAAGRARRILRVLHDGNDGPRVRERPPRR